MNDCIFSFIITYLTFLLLSSNNCINNDRLFIYNTIESRKILFLINKKGVHIQNNKEQFINNLDFFGFYRPKGYSDMSENDRMNFAYNVKYMAERLSSENLEELGYNLTNQIWYSEDKNGDGKVNPYELTSMRCDGLVEYCYEYYGQLVYGDNITVFNKAIRNNHCYPNISPKIQSQRYMQNCIGDVNNDGAVTTEDAQLALNFAVRLSSPGRYEFYTSDVNGDSTVTVEDARLILRYATGLITVFPIENL